MQTENTLVRTLEISDNKWLKLKKKKNPLTHEPKESQSRAGYSHT